MQQLVSDIRSGQFRSVYLLFGTEPYLIRFYVQRIIEKTVAEEDRIMNLTILKEEEATARAISENADMYPMFGEKRVVLVRDSGWFSGKKEAASLTELTRTIDNLLPTTLLLFEESQVDKRSALYKAVVKAGYAAELNEPDESSLIRFLAREFAANHKQISEETARFALSRMGTDMIHIHHEVEKVSALAGEDPIVTRAQIAALCRPQPETNIFRMTDAIGYGRKKEALQIYEDLLSANEAPQLIFYMLSQQLRRIYRLKVAQEYKITGPSAASFIGISPKAVWIYEKQAGRFSKDKLRGLIDRMTVLDEKMKTGLLDASDGVLELVSLS